MEGGGGVGERGGGPFAASNEVICYMHLSSLLLFFIERTSLDNFWVVYAYFPLFQVFFGLIC